MGSLSQAGNPAALFALGVSGRTQRARALFSSLSRYLRDFGVAREAWPLQEERILRIFKRKAHQAWLYCCGVISPENTFHRH